MIVPLIAACTLIGDAEVDAKVGVSAAEGDSDADADSDTDADSDAVDADSDGWTAEQGDCADADPAVNPGADEICRNGIDDDCDGTAAGCELESGSLAGADVMWTGEEAGDNAGGSLGGPGDFNGDGWGDVAIGAPAAASSRPGPRSPVATPSKWPLSPCRAPAT